MPVVLDGEIVAFGPDGRRSFKALGPRMHLRRPHRIQALAQSNPVSYIRFDVPHCGDKSQIALPHAERRRGSPRARTGGAALEDRPLPTTTSRTFSPSRPFRRLEAGRAARRPGRPAELHKLGRAGGI
ncbi:hypothetical protein AB0C84_27030 [Actinomadura sp. NPDC048955]|uniref:hypothetical protein n=1 Tax=Actinomadura sp. NPDC048955 TaxID=3158228 RepID=UPI0033C1B089